MARSAPVSRMIHSANSAPFSSTMRAALRKIAARASYGIAAHCSCASEAARADAATSCATARPTLVRRLPVAFSVTSAVPPAVVIQEPVNALPVQSASFNNGFLCHSHRFLTPGSYVIGIISNQAAPNQHAIRSMVPNPETVFSFPCHLVVILDDYTWRLLLRTQKERMRSRLSLLMTELLMAGSFMSPSTAHAQTTSSAPGTTTPIQHLVVIFQENISFDHYFGTYPNADESRRESPRSRRFRTRRR